MTDFKLTFNAESYTANVVPLAPPVTPTPVSPEYDTTPRFVTTFPPGPVGELAREYLEMMPYPNETMAIGWALTAIAGLTQRSYHANGLATTIHLMTLAETGSGKDMTTKGQATFIDQIGIAIQLPALSETLIGPANFASGPAIKKHMATHPRQWSVFNEASFLFQEMQNDRDTHGASKKAALLDIRFKSDLGKRQDAYINASKGDSAVNVCYSPSLTLLCEGQADRFYASIDEQSARDGLINRFTILDCTRNHRGLRNKRMRHEFSAPVIMKFLPLGSKVARVVDANIRPDMIEVMLDRHAEALLNQYEGTVVDKLSHERDRIEYEIFNRSLAQAWSIAASLAIPNNPDAPVITYAEMNWALEFTYRERKWILDKYRANETGTGAIQRVAALRKCLLESFPRSQSSRLSTIAKKNGIVPYAWILDTLGGYAAFRAIGTKEPTDLLREAIATLLATGALTDVAQESAKEHGLSGKCYQIDWDLCKNKK
ncbi:hypothetical protein ACQZ5N_00990 [Agrobacterium sp. 22-221-1]